MNATPPVPPPLPVKSGGPPRTDEHYDLYQRVLAAIHALPNHFHTVLNIEGVAATDLFTLNTALGASIEQSMVDCLNDLRELWDPTNKYSLYRFVRQAQSFPDVRLQTEEPSAHPKIIFGIELKGWFTLAKEGEPSFRYKVTPDACAVMDLLVVVPWVFNNVISGTPVLLKPIITEARYAAQMRNYHWEHLRGTKNKATAGIKMSTLKTPYPDKTTKSSDEPVSDSGGNFGRIARSRIFDDEVEEVMQKPAGGIPLRWWHYFLSLFREKASDVSIGDDLQKVKSSFESKFHLTVDQIDALQDAFGQVAKVFEMEPANGITKGSAASKKI